MSHNTLAAPFTQSPYARIICLDDFAVARLSCTAVRERQVIVLKDYLHDVAQRVDGRLAVSMADVTSCSPSFLAVLAELSGPCGEAGGRVVVFGLNPPVRKMFKMTKVHEHVDIVRTEDDAGAIFRGMGQPGFPMLWS